MIRKLGQKGRQWVISFLKQGLTPDKLALCVSMSAAIAVFPVIGSTTFLCLVAGSLARLNQPAMQSVNFAVYPLQFVLLIPFYKLGSWIFRSEAVTVTVGEVRHLIASGVWHAIVTLWTVTWHAMVAWCLVAPVVIAGLYWFFKRVFRKVAATI